MTTLRIVDALIMPVALSLAVVTIIIIAEKFRPRS